MMLVRPLAKNMLLSRGKKTKKTKQINRIIEKEREIQKLIYSIKPKITSHIAIYNKKPNYYYLIEHRYYIELARTLADNVLRHLKISEIFFEVTAAKYFTEFLP